MDCFCFDDLINVTLSPNSWCNFSCPGNPTQTCGGNGSALSLFDTSKSTKENLITLAIECSYNRVAHTIKRPLRQDINKWLANCDSDKFDYRIVKIHIFQMLILHLQTLAWSSFDLELFRSLLPVYICKTHLPIHWSVAGIICLHLIL